MNAPLQTTTSPLNLGGLRRAWNWFFFESADPRASAAVRIAYGVLLLLMLGIELPDIGMWYSSSGVLPFEVSRCVVDADTWTIFQWLPDNLATVRWCYGIFMVQSLLLLLGVRPRLQAICVLMWLTSFQHRNCMLVDGGNTVFRLFAFLLALSPCGCRWSIDSWLHARRHGKPSELSSRFAWAVRLMQIQVAVIYASTAWEKLNGEAWLDGTAIYYTSRLDDLFGRGPVPDMLFNDLTALKWMTWAVLATEVCLPIALWLRETRGFAILAAIGLHLSIEWMMHLFLFEWIMIAALLSFVTAADVSFLKSLFARIFMRRRQPRNGRATRKRRRAMQPN